jgi:hypothetical protein
MGRGRGVQNRDFDSVFNHIEDARNEDSGIECDRFPRFEIDLGSIFFSEPGYQAAEPIDIVIGTADMMPPPEIDPLHPG